MDEQTAAAPAAATTVPRGRLAAFVATRSGLDWLAAALLAAGGASVAAGLLPMADAEASVRRIAPLLLFLATVFVLAELAAKAELFHVIATRVTIAARGSNLLLFTLSIGFTAATTMFLNLDTTAVLLTPVMLLTAVKSGVPRLPLAMTTVWLANTASLLLPVSNLTNLLAADRVQLSPLAFAARMWLPQLVALAVVAGCLWLFYWRSAPDRYQPPQRHVPPDRRLFVAASLTCLGFIGGVLSGWPLEIVSTVLAGVLVAAFARWGRRHLNWGLVPWRLLVFVTGLFLVVDTVGRLGLSQWLGALIGTDPGAEGVARAAATGGALSNLLNNLPAYVAGEAVVPPGNHDQLLALLISTNVAPLITPWASLATLIWAEHCRLGGVTIGWSRFVATGAVTAVAVTTSCVAALALV